MGEQSLSGHKNALEEGGAVVNSLGGSQSLDNDRLPSAGGLGAVFETPDSS